MNNFQADMNRVVSSFVDEITRLARAAAMEMIDSALGSKRGPRIASQRRGGKRASGDIDRLASAFHAFVAKNPGMRIEQINKQLGTTTKDLQLPVRKLISDGALKTKGKKRSTTYFAAKV